MSGYKQIYSTTATEVYTLSEDSYPVRGFIPVISGDLINDQIQSLIRKGVVPAKGVSTSTRDLLLKIGSRCCYLYQTENDLHPTNPKFYWFICPLSIPMNMPNADFPVCEDIGENKALVRSFIKGIRDWCVEAAGMLRDHEKFVRIAIHLLLDGAAKGPHFDPASGKDFTLMWMRGILSVGTERDIIFRATETTKSRTLEGKSCQPAKNIEKYVHHANEGVHFYLTSPLCSGTHPIAFTNEERTSGIQLTHEVLVKKNGKKGLLAIFDFPLPSVEAHNQLLASLPENCFHINQMN